MQKSELDDLVLLRASTRPTEFRWNGTQHEEARWEDWLAAHQQGAVETLTFDGPPMSYALQLTPQIWLSIQCRTDGKPELALQGPSAERSTLERAQTMMRELEKHAYEDELENPIFEVYTGLQASLSTGDDSDFEEQRDESTAAQQKEPSAPQTSSDAVQMLRVIFWSHHLKAPSKKRDINKWCAELDVFGLVKSGYPGFLCFEGELDSVQEMVRRIKALQWHAITVKTDVPYSIRANIDHKCNNGGDARSAVLLQCKLAIGHSCMLQRDRDAKLRLSMDEVETSGELVKRLRDAGIAEDEIKFALNLRS